MMRGSLTKAVLLLKSMPPLMLSSSVMLRAKAATSSVPSVRAQPNFEAALDLVVGVELQTRR